MKYFLTLMLLIPLIGVAQQVVDPGFDYSIKNPLFKKGKGLVVAIDEGHNNFHTLDGRYSSFAKLLSSDGFQMISISEKIDTERLKRIDVLVISNPIHESNLESWVLPNPSAYSDKEIREINNWVENGGRLFLIADHMPFGGAAADLAKSFGFTFTNGFARWPEQNGFDTFSRVDQSLLDHEVTEQMDKVMTFTGQAFQIPSSAKGLLKFPKGSISLEPDTAWTFNENTFRRDIENWYQGALLSYGKGRIAVFGEAAMFTTQLAGARRLKVGMNTKGAEQNVLLLRNVMKWLSHK